MNSNRLCNLLGIRYPIVQAPMNWVSGADLVVAVSQAGGLGALGPNAGAKTLEPDVTITAERLREQIKKVKSLTDKPFAINIAIGGDEFSKYAAKCVQVVLEEKAPVVITSVGSPDVFTKTLKSAGIKVLHAISTPKHARKAEKEGVDAVICEGYEAGGHKGFTELTSMALIPMVADCVKIPVIAAGGIADVRGVLAALALGADGVYMGTRFMITQESDSDPKVKESVIKGEEVCTICIPKDTMLGRDLQNAYTKKFHEMKAAGASRQEFNQYLSEHTQYRAQVTGDAEEGEICCGQVAGLIHDNPSAAEVIEGIAKAMNSVVDHLKRKLSCF